MCRVFDAADFFIDAAADDAENNMTNMRINKLLYFAQGWSLARLGKPLFKENILAWKHGPVVKKVYNRFRFAGSNKIAQMIHGTYDKDLKKEEQDLLIDALLRYDNYSTSGLVTLSHQKNSPWAMARELGENEVIPTEIMKDYFSQLPPLERFTLPPIGKDDVVGYVNKKTGAYVLPKEWDDESVSEQYI